MDLLAKILPDNLSELTWTHEPTRWQILPTGTLRVTTPEKVDYFRAPDGVHVYDSACFLWLVVEGDFVAQTRVRPAFASTYDAGCLMVRHDGESGPSYALRLPIWVLVR